MSITVSSILANYSECGTRRVNVKGVPGVRKITMPSYMTKPQVFMPTHRLLNCENGSINPNMFSSTSQVTFTIKRNDVDSVKDLHAKIVINVVGSSVTLAQLPLWFSQINVRTSFDNGLIATMYGDTAIANLCTIVPIGKQKSLFKTLNIDPSPHGYLGTTNAYPPGQYTFYLPMFVNSVIGNFAGLRLADSTADLSFEFFPCSPIVSGNGTITLQSFGFAVESSKLELSDIAAYTLMYDRFSTECTFLDPICTTFSSKVLTAGAVNYFNLSAVTGLASHQLFVVRPVGSINNNIGNASFNWLNVGDEGASLDLVDVNNASIWGNGSPVSTKFMRSHIAADQSDNNFICTKPCYYLNYCDSIRGSMQGQIRGGYKFNASNVSIALTLPSAPVQEVQTITFSSTPTASGYYRFAFRGELSAELSVSASASSIMVALQTMKTFASQFITVIASGSISSSNTLTLVFSHPATAGLEGDLVTIVSDGFGASGITTRTTPGTAGLNTGLFDVNIYTFVFKTGSYVGGVLRSDLYTY